MTVGGTLVLDGAIYVCTFGGKKFTIEVPWLH